MEKWKTIEAINTEFLLPEGVIQHIQSFLTGKEAAQTTVISKSWYNAWLTRPNLDIDERDFKTNQYQNFGFWDSRTTESYEEFSGFAKKTMQRYEELNLKIDSLRLCMKEARYDGSDILANELIVKAFKMGATRLSFDLGSKNSEFVLPHEVLGSENLVRLSVQGCRIYTGINRKVRCSRLQSLSLFYVDIESHMIWDIVSSCPLLEKLSLSTIMFENQCMGLVGDGVINLYELHKLKCLLLCNVKIDSLFFRDLWSKFPCLKDLTLHCCHGYEKLRISSLSLECINYAEEKRGRYAEERRRLRVKFDVPSIRKFTFEGSAFPSLSFKPSSREWESHVSMRYYGRLSTTWFHKLNKLLTKLSLSKISLSLDIGSRMNLDYMMGDIQFLSKPEVENLTIDLQRVPTLICCALFDILFRCCRPKFITQYWICESSFGEKTNIDVLCKILVQGMNEKMLDPKP